ncbi:MAG TPA: glutamate--tRNA ligase family protein, partial [Planctomycetota bacterium]|nr:glutamate--tRNA ligase family protein [Planctomycetota bacterium]
SVVDDAAAGVTRVARGRDLATSTAVQVALQRLLGLATPVYRHHLLLLEQRGEKLAKLHGAVGVGELRRVYDARELRGVLARAVGLRAAAAPASPVELLADFDWVRIRGEDRVLHWDGERLIAE